MSGMISRPQGVFGLGIRKELNTSAVVGAFVGFYTGGAYFIVPGAIGLVTLVTSLWNGIKSNYEAQKRDLQSARYLEELEGRKREREKKMAFIDTAKSGMMLGACISATIASNYWKDIACGKNSIIGGCAAPTYINLVAAVSTVAFSIIFALKLKSLKKD